MKNKYVKPALVVEIFPMIQTTARDCCDSIPQEQVNFNDISSCVWDLGGEMKLFTLDGDCTLDGEKSGIVCYNNPGEGFYIFRS